MQIFANGPNQRAVARPQALCRNTPNCPARHARPASTSKNAHNQRGRRPKGCSKARQPMALTSCTCCRTRGRATGRTRPQAQRSCPAPAAASATYFRNHFTSRRRAYFRLTVSFRNSRPNLAYFRILPPYAYRLWVYGTWMGGTNTALSDPATASH